MAQRRRDDDFDQRLENEIITDAKPYELWIAWYYYLDDHLRFPFKARCVAERLTSPLEVGEVVEVHGMCWMSITIAAILPHGWIAPGCRMLPRERVHPGAERAAPSLSGDRIGARRSSWIHPRVMHSRRSQARTSWLRGLPEPPAAVGASKHVPVLISLA